MTSLEPTPAAPAAAPAAPAAPAPAAEVHGIKVRDAERVRPLVFGMLLGEKSQSKVSKLVLDAPRAGGINRARSIAGGVAGKALPNGWGEVLTQQLPDSALAPLATALARQALKASGKVGARTVGKMLPFGIGAVIGGVGGFTFGRDMVKAKQIAFPMPPVAFPDALLDFTKAEPGMASLDSAETSRAMKAMQSAAGSASGLGEIAWDKTSGARSAIKGAAVCGASAIKGAAVCGASAIKGAAVCGASAIRLRLKRNS